MATKTKKVVESKPKMMEERRKNLQNVESPPTPQQIIFADAIVNIGFGPAVSRFALGIENTNRTLAPFMTVVIPTHRLIEGIAAIQTGLASNPEMRIALLKGLEQIKMAIEKIDTK